jgi:hypothetical protein
LVGSTFLCPTIFGQNDFSYHENTLDSSEIHDLIALSKYDKTVRKLKLKSPDLQEKESREPDKSFVLGPILKSLFYLFIAGLVILIVYLIFSSIKVDKTIKPVTTPKIDPIEDIEVIDTQSGLEMALKAENYRDALRMLFLKLLQVLVLEKRIEWKPEKTNRHYLSEMKQHEKFQHFSNLVMAYERIWYGSEPIDKLFFDYLKADFEKFYSTENVRINAKE